MAPPRSGSVRPTPPGRAAGGPTRATGWLGVVAVGAAVLWLAIIGGQTLVGSRDLSATLVAAQWRTVGPALVAVVVALVLVERRWPAVPRPLLARGHLVDAGYLALFAVAVVPMLTVVETGFAVEVERHARFLLVSRLSFAPEVVVVAAILVGIDAMNWAAHVANHRSASLWRLHALHHSQEDMSVLTTFRTHPLVHATYLGALLPALVLGASGVVPGAALVAYGCLVTLPHANLRWTFGPVGRVLVSPAYHRLHHASAPIDSRGTVNFGFVLVCWDQLARHALFPSPGTPVATGLAGRPVPVEQSAGRARRVVAAQLAQPFRIHSTMDDRS
jgi:sterol desaturase/sphingolipid hydroxylase (fatty acid hydroxylase superfamily)